MFACHLRYSVLTPASGTTSALSGAASDRRRFSAQLLVPSARPRTTFYSARDSPLSLVGERAVDRQKRLRVCLECARWFSRSGSRSGVLTALLLLLSLPHVADAQSVRVRVIDTKSRAPVAGAIVSLISERDGNRMGAALSDELGMVSLTPTEGLRIKVQVERIGYATVVSEAFDASAASGIMEVELTEKSLQLPTVAVKGRQTCQAASASTQTAILWQEVQKALSATLLSTPRRNEMRLWRYTRSLDRELRVLAETTSMRVIDGGAPFTTAPASLLSREGFIQELGGTPTYFAPDAALLLSDSFVADHCFSVRATVSPGPVIGLTFSPLPTRKVAEVSGVLWLNNRSGELLWLEYSYVGPLSGGGGTLAGGRLDFSVLPNGQWIIDQWHIRIPRRAVIRSRRGAGTEIASRDTVIGYREEGGWVVMGGTSLDPTSDSAAVAGLVFDSTSGGPLEGARVSLAGGSYQALTDSTGRYRVRVNLPGRYVVTLDHPRLNSLAIPSLERDVAVSRASTTTLNFGVPGVASLRARLCPGTNGSPESGVVLAQVFDSATNQPLGGVRVTASWRDVGLRQADARAIAAFADSVIEVESNAAGVALICGRPAGERITLRAAADGRTVERSITVTVGALSEARLTLGPARGHGNPVRGVVLAGSGANTRPLAGAEVLLPSLQMSARTTAGGNFAFGRLDEGRHAVVVRSVGFRPVLTHVQLPVPPDSLLRFVLEPLAPELAPVVITGRASTGRMSEFEERKATNVGGSFLSRDDLEKREHSRLSDVLRSLRGVRVQRLRNGSEVVLSSRSTRMDRRGSAKECYYQIYLDGIRVYAPGIEEEAPPDINAFAPVGLEGIEVYSGSAVTPPKFSGVNAACGTIVLWTRTR